MDLSGVPAWAWLIVGAVVVLMLYGIVEPVVEGVLKAARYGKKQVDQKFWRDAGRVTTLVSVVLLAVAYGFYGPEQTRTLPHAAADLVKEQIADILPLAILTQWLLLLAFLLLFGRLMRVPLRTLFEPLGMVRHLAVFTVAMAAFTAWVTPLFGIGEFDGFAWAAVAIFAILVYLACVFAYTPAQRRAEALKRQGFSRRLWFGSDPDRSRWIVTPLAFAVMAVFLVGLLSVIAGIVYGIYVAGELAAPSREGVIRVELIVMAVVFLFSCFYYRSELAERRGVPEGIFGFIDFSLALSACAIALSGLGSASVTLGTVPVWVVAAGPPILVALVVFVSNIIRVRKATNRWGACLLASVVAGAAVLPVKWLLELILAPVVDSVF